MYMYADANVHSLDGYTCEGTPSLMDGPQSNKAMHMSSLGVTSWHPQQATTATTGRQLPLPTTATTAYDSLRQPTTAHTRDHSYDSYDSLRQPTTALRQRQLRQHTTDVRQPTTATTARAQIKFVWRLA